MEIFLFIIVAISVYLAIGVFIVQSEADKSFEYALMVRSNWEFFVSEVITWFPNMMEELNEDR